MTKKTFLKRLQTKLNDLDEERINSILSKYESIIDEEVRVGKPEEEVVSSLGSIDVIAKLYTKDNNSKQTKKEEKTQKMPKEGYNVDKIFDMMFKYMDDAFKQVDGDLAKRILTIMCFVVVGYLCLSLLHLPFRLVDLMGTGIFGVIFNDYYFFEIASACWTFSINICYAILVIWLIVKYVNKIVYRYSPKTSKVSKHEDVKEEKKEKKEEVKKNSNASDAIFIIIKIFIIILTMPLLIFEAILFIPLFLVISLAISGVTLFGPLLIILGLIIMVGTLIDVIYTSLFKGELK